jgi:outer membrane protein assembly factor BamB
MTERSSANRLSGLVTLVSSLFFACAFPANGATPLHDWSFSKEAISAQAINSVGGNLTGSFESRPVTNGFGVRFDGSTSLDVPGMTPDQLPSERITADAWVSLDAGTKWGSIVGFYQDNGSYEKGWLLGYNDSHFVFSVSTASKLHTITSKTAFEKGKWYHVAGSFDGKSMKLYVNGVEESAGSAAIGKIAYPEKAYYTIGAYRDQDEFFRMKGTVHRVRLYGDALTVAEIRSLHAEGKSVFPRGLTYTVKPHLRFDSPRSATVYWETDEPGQAILQYGQGETLNFEVEGKTQSRNHSMTLDDLEPGEVYHYRITMVSSSGVKMMGETYELDMRMNFAVPAMPDRTGVEKQEISQAARHFIKESGVNRGVCLVYGFGSGELAYELARQSDLVVFGFDDDKERVSKARKWLYGKGVYGTRVSVTHVEDMNQLPVTGHIANLLVSENILTGKVCPGNAVEMNRLLRPGGGVAILGTPPGAPQGVPAQEIADWLAAGEVKNTKLAGGQWFKVEPGPMADSGEWTHQYGNAGNTTSSDEKLGGATRTDELEVQWVGRPGADFGIDRNPRMPAPLSSWGRLFHQGMNRMIALDAYNGSALWSLEIPDLRRVNMPRDASNWCTDGKALFVAVKDRCWEIDAANGHRKAAHSMPAPYSPETHDWGYVAQGGDLFFGSAVKKDSSYTAFFGGGMWYDKREPKSAAKVCSEGVFATRKTDGKLAWSYSGGTVLNPTISIRDNKLFFVESRNSEILKQSTGRLHGPNLWKDQFLVALDAYTGKKLWEEPIDTADGTVVFYMLATEHGLVIQSSTGGKYHLYNHDLKTGKQKWETAFKWPNDHHSGHMQHPVAVNGRLYLEPSAFDLKTGKKVVDQIGKRSGCHTYVGTRDALIYRGAGRQIAMWGQETKKVSTWNRLRPSCWLSVIPAAGMLLVPEGGGGCSCGGWMETSLAFRPRLKAKETKSKE